MKNTDSCAVYLAADPLTKAEVQVVTEAKKIYKNVDIILDRKNQSSQYRLSFANRAEIIKHDFKELGIDDYVIVPNDTTLCNTLKTRKFKTLVLGMHPGTESTVMNRVRLLKKFSDDLQIVSIPVQATCSSTTIDMLMKESNSKECIAKTDYMSNYAFMKTKLNLTHKIGLAGDGTDKTNLVMSLFKDKNIEVINLDIIKSSEWLNFVTDAISQSMSDTVIILSSKLFKSKIDEICDDIVCVYSNKLSTQQSENMKQSDMFIDATGNDQSVIKHVLNLINYRLKI